MREEGRGKRDVFYSLFSSDLCLSVLIRGSMPALPCTITMHGLPHFSQYGFTECLPCIEHASCGFSQVSSLQGTTITDDYD